MKFIMHHSLTCKLLERYHKSSWVIAGYFFHDQGTVVQKSAQRFLQELLYQLLRQRKGLFLSIYPQFLRLDETHNLKDPKGLAEAWTIGELKESLLRIVSQSTSDMNVCLFVDALDEHNGNHRDLLPILSRLTQLTNNTFFRLLLCLAGRPENVFKDAFHTLPGFSIHEFTTDGTRLYAEGRMRAEVKGEFTDEGAEQVSGLIGDIVKMADGIFLWVRLVVDELVEGLCEGDSAEELRELLSIIPTELEDLYTRAIRRTHWISLLTLTKQREEAYVMFQIAIYARQSFSIYLFLAATLFLTTGRRTYPDLQRLSLDQMERRLNSRSAEMLDAPGRPTSACSLHSPDRRGVHGHW